MSLGRPCSVCTHELHHRIQWRLLRRESRRAIARSFGLSEASVRRHAANHLEPGIRAAMAAMPEVARACLATLPRRLEHAAEQLEASAVKAPRRRAVERCAEAARELASLYATLAAISGVLPRS